MAVEQSNPLTKPIVVEGFAANTMHSGGRNWYLFENYPSSGKYPFTEFTDGSGTRYIRLARGMFVPCDATPQETNSVYAHWAPQYDSQHPWVPEYGRNAVLLCGQPTGNVIDLGTGTGLVIEGLIQGGIDPKWITGVDNSTAMLDYARSKAVQGPLTGVNFVDLDLTELALSRTFPGKGVGLITAGYSLSNLPQSSWEGVLGDIMDTLHENGFLVIIDSLFRGAPHSQAFRKLTNQMFGPAVMNSRICHHHPINGYDFPVGYQVVSNQLLNRH